MFSCPSLCASAGLPDVPGCPFDPFPLALEGLREVAQLPLRVSSELPPWRRVSGMSAGEETPRPDETRAPIHPGVTARLRAGYPVRTVAAPLERGLVRWSQCSRKNTEFIM